MRDARGTPDTHGAVLEVIEIAVADELAAAAELVKGKADGVPVAVVRGLDNPVCLEAHSVNGRQSHRPVGRMQSG